VCTVCACVGVCVPALEAVVQLHMATHMKGTFQVHVSLPGKKNVGFLNELCMEKEQHLAVSCWCIYIEREREQHWGAFEIPAICIAIPTGLCYMLQSTKCVVVAYSPARLWQNRTCDNKEEQKVQPKPSRNTAWPGSR
jgi:hypothetical protein